MRGNASPIEEAWTFIGFIALAFTLYLLLDCWKDFRAVQEAMRRGWLKPDADDWWVAVRDLGVNVFYVVGWLGFIFVGIFAMNYPPPPPSLAQQPANVLVGWILIAMESVFGASQIWMWFCRRKLSIGKGGQAARPSRNRVH